MDSSVLLDVFGADPTFGAASRAALRRCVREGDLVACDVVWAEVVASLKANDPADEAMRRLGVRFSPLEASAATAAGTSWRSYRREGGTRVRLVADFLVGAHARTQADRLVTRDRGFYRRYFADLRILDPTAEAARGTTPDPT